MWASGIAVRTVDPGSITQAYSFPSRFVKRRRLQKLERRFEVWSSTGYFTFSMLGDRTPPPKALDSSKPTSSSRISKIFGARLDGGTTCRKIGNRSPDRCDQLFPGSESPDAGGSISTWSETRLVEVPFQQSKKACTVTMGPLSHRLVHFI